MTEDEREDLVYRLLGEFRQSVGSGFDKLLGMGFEAGARSACHECEAQIDRWRNRAAAAEAVLEFIVAGYARVVINHEDFRVCVYKAALEVLETSPLPPAVQAPIENKGGGQS